VTPIEFPEYVELESEEQIGGTVPMHPAIVTHSIVPHPVAPSVVVPNAAPQIIPANVNYFLNNI
tara:strand:- start:414 stop:605 length:192 start_codon:yes stop_codon:yes gene_type:complete